MLVLDIYCHLNPKIDRIVFRYLIYYTLLFFSKKTLSNTAAVLPVLKKYPYNAFCNKALAFYYFLLNSIQLFV